MNFGPHLRTFAQLHDIVLSDPRTDQRRHQRSHDQEGDGVGSVHCRYMTRLQKKLHEVRTLFVHIPLSDEVSARLLSDIETIVPNISHYTNRRLRIPINLSIVMLHDMFKIVGSLRDIYSFFGQGIGALFLHAFWVDVVTMNGSRLTANEYKSCVVSHTVDEQSTSTCGICMEHMKQKESLVQVQCQHVFHNRCLRKWLVESCSQPTCPLCRQRCLPAI